ncbi:MAG: M61 family metallopeptidase [Burkholderiaceae bacterium]
MPATRRSSPQAAPRSSAVHYRVQPADPHAHLYRVTLTVAQPAAHQGLSLPVWIPGSYLVREFSKNVQQLEATQGGRPVALAQLDKCSWRADCAAGVPLVLTYSVYALDNSVRTAWLDAARGFFNPTSLCLRVHGAEEQPHDLEVTLQPAAKDRPRTRRATESLARWELATALKPVKVNARGFGLYRAADYDELADSPVEMGTFWSAEFRAAGVPHRLVVAGAPASFDGARLVADAQRICEHQIRFWHGRRKPPIDRYVFMLNVVNDGYGGLEHRHCTALIASRRDLPRVGEARASDGYTTLLGLISHEYFHTWNVKRMRPAEFARYDYTRENYTQLLWFFEGFTSYYDDLLLRRCGLIDDATYLKLLNKTINQVDQAPGRLVQSVAQASFDAWVKYYRQDENTPNQTISYYSKGALVALCLDLTLRSEGQTTLDEVMRGLWARSAGGPLSEADILSVLREKAGRSFEREFAQWVHGTRELPLPELLPRLGVAVSDDAAQWQQRLGLRSAEANGSVMIKNVLRGGAAEQAGFSAGDEWLGIEVAGQGWRLSRVDDLPLYAGANRKVTAIVSRDARLLRLPLDLGAAVHTRRLVLRDAALAAPWLSGAS